MHQHQTSHLHHHQAQPPHNHVQNLDSTHQSKTMPLTTIKEPTTRPLTRQHPHNTISHTRRQILQMQPTHRPRTRTITTTIPKHTQLFSPQLQRPHQPPTRSNNTQPLQATQFNVTISHTIHTPSKDRHINNKTQLKILRPQPLRRPLHLQRKQNTKTQSTNQISNTSQTPRQPTLQQLPHTHTIPCQARSQPLHQT